MKKTPCGDKRQEDRGEERKVAKKAFKLEEIAEMPITLTVMPGCVEGDKLVLSITGEDRAVLAYGNALQVAQYAIGEQVQLSGEKVPKKFVGTYCRSINRKQTEAISRIKDEMYGSGQVQEMAQKAKNGNYNGFTITANGEKVTTDSLLNSYFQKITFVEGNKGGKTVPVAKPVDELTRKDKKILRDGKPVEAMGGVELVISAIIVPGAYSKNDVLKTYQ